VRIEFLFILRTTPYIFLKKNEKSMPDYILYLWSPRLFIPRSRTNPFVWFVIKEPNLIT
jgi:hypothetical protein